MNNKYWTTGIWQEATNYYNQYRNYNLGITISGRDLLDLSDEVIIIHRPDKMSPKKKIMRHTME